jgi:terminal uridylyltransferase
MAASPPKNRAEIVEGVGRALSEASRCGQLAVLEDLNTRPTARIPLINFKLRGVDVDISVHNPLALRNSDMLAAYAKCDSRLVSLGYVLKYWAKRRHVNNASEGTLSSYGYLLALIHFLQTRNPPILPNLQAIPPNWDGNPNTAPREAHPRSNLPSYPVAHPVDGHLVETYFYTPPNGNYTALKNYGQSNRSSVGALFIEFFHYMALQLECADDVISVRTPTLSKLLKAETDCWPLHARLSIEDPFELNYDVAHPVKKTSRVEWMRAEFIRVVNMAQERNANRFGSLLNEMCEEAPLPPFLDPNQRGRAMSLDERLRSNTIDE